MSAATTIIEQIAARRTDRHQKAVETKYPRSHPIASDIGDCHRETVLGVTHWQDKPAFPADLGARFERGNNIENWVILELQHLGFTVRVDRAPWEIMDRKGRLVCRGKVDGFISDGLTDGRAEVPFEVKSLYPYIYQSINEVADFDRFFFSKKYPRQLQLYLYANNLPEGFFLLDDCMGHWKMIHVELDLEKTEAILQQIEGAVDHINNGTLPGYHDDPSVCRKCWAYGRVCTPPMQNEGWEVLGDETIARDLDRRAECEPQHQEYAAIDKRVKARFRGKSNIIVGDWIVTGKEGEQKKKAQEATTVKTWRTTIKRISEDEKEAE